MKKGLLLLFMLLAILFSCSQDNELTEPSYSNNTELSGDGNDNKTNNENDNADDEPKQPDQSDGNNEKDNVDNEPDKNDSNNNIPDQSDSNNSNENDNIDDGQKYVWLQVEDTYQYDTSHSESAINWLYYNGIMDYKCIRNSQTISESNGNKSVSNATTTTIAKGNQQSLNSEQTYYLYDSDENEIQTSSYSTQGEIVITYFEEMLPIWIVKSSYTKASTTSNGNEIVTDSNIEYTLEYLGTENDYKVYKCLPNYDNSLYNVYKIKDGITEESIQYHDGKVINKVKYSIPNDEFLAELGFQDMVSYDSDGNIMSTNKYFLKSKVENEATIDFVTELGTTTTIQSHKYKRFAYPFVN